MVEKYLCLHISNSKERQKFSGIKRLIFELKSGCEFHALISIEILCWLLIITPELFL